MKKTVKVLAIVLSAVLMLSALAACRGNAQNTPAPTAAPTAAAEKTAAPTEAPATKTPDEPPAEAPMDITVYLWGDKPNQMDDVLAEFNARSKDYLNVNLDIKWTPYDDYINNITLRLSAGEPVDACFDAPWMNMNTFILQGNYRDLTKYFLNDDYPGLKKSFSSDYLANNYMGANGDQVYGIPLTQSFGGGAMIYIRGDLRQKYGCAPVTDLASFEAYLQAIKDNEPSMIPYVMKNDGTYGALAIFDAQYPELGIGKPDKGIWDLYIAPGIVATLYIQDYQVKECYISGVEPMSGLSGFPAPYNEKDYTSLKKVREWYEKGYIEKDVITRADAMSEFTAGKAASFMWDPAQYNMVMSGVLASVPDSSIETWTFNPLLDVKTRGLLQGSFQAWNFICIPVTTPDEKADRIMKMFDWIFSSSENHDLLEFGIDGKHFVSIGDSEYTYPDGIDLAGNYNFPGYELTWNPGFIRYQKGYPADVLNLMVAINNPDAYYDPMLSGFRFNGEPIKNELANPDFADIKTENDNLTLGIFPDPEAQHAKILGKAAGNATLMEDIAAIKAEVLRQAEVYLAGRKAQDAARGTKYPTLAELRRQFGN